MTDSPNWDQHIIDACLDGKPAPSVTDAEAAYLRPIAETLAMLTGNAFFEIGDFAWRQWLPEAKALFEGNGGMSGWAGGASFAQPHRHDGVDAE